MRQSRSPKLGDILVVTLNDHRSSRPLGDVKYVGMVYKIILDKWGHKNEVFVSWQGEYAPNYNRVHGYCGSNIHNLRSEFRVIRNGVDIP
jgi:hypothetical protein